MFSSSSKFQHKASKASRPVVEYDAHFVVIGRQGIPYTVAGNGELFVRESSLDGCSRRERNREHHCPPLVPRRREGRWNIPAREEVRIVEPLKRRGAGTI
jgi:hypothetical protein